MSLIKKSDVKKHLSDKASGKMLLFRPQSQPDATGYSGSETPASDGNASTPLPASGPAVHSVIGERQAKASAGTKAPA